ncbi:hypothetical protein BDD12DRAFT_877351 [Trichophaea hybrida]|nr:hypothetical protein BDD12DRAFT_895919 [Trichophaea hybrida]KAF8542028.1 hypothetical protein BDD12DRAFT_877351 [Trichophaea hybrida]
MSNPASTTSTSAAALTEPQKPEVTAIEAQFRKMEEDAAAAGEREDEGDWTEENEMEAAN